MSFTPIDDNGSSQFGNLVSVETFTQLATNLNALIHSMPIGTKIMILTGLPGVPEPDPSIWAPCEGGVVTDQNSPLHDQTLPDDRGHYPKGCTTIGQAGNTAGTHSKSWPHNHSGLTGTNTIQSDNNDDNADTDDDYITVYPHNHPIAPDLRNVIDVQPVHIRVRYYIKIR